MIKGLFEDTLDWLRETYWTHDFYVERDLVWTIQKKLSRMIVERKLPFRVFNDYPIAPGNRRSLCTDLAVIMDADVLLAIEFKYEPDHDRGKGKDPNILPSKLNPSVVSWEPDGVLKDVERCSGYVADGRSKASVSLFVDEGGCFRHRDPHEGTTWIDWQHSNEKTPTFVIDRPIRIRLKVFLVG